VKNDSISHQSRRDPYRYRWIHLLPAIVKNDSISHQSRRDPYRYRWIHLLPAIVKNDSISHQSRRDPSRYRWIHLQKYTCNLFSLLERVKAVELLHLLFLQLVSAVSGYTHLQSLGERHFGEAAAQLSHRLFPQLATMESNSDFNKEPYLKARRKTYSL
jgi:hypothetical protein